MGRKRLIHCVPGVLMGMGMIFLVPALINHAPLSTRIYSDAFLEQTGSPAAAVLLTLLVTGVYAALCAGGTMCYEIEKGPLALAAAHYLVIALPCALVSRLLRWDMPARLFLIIKGLMALGFILIWLTMYRICKAQVRELNELLKQKYDYTGKENNQ